MPYVYCAQSRLTMAGGFLLCLPCKNSNNLKFKTKKYYLNCIYKTLHALYISVWKRAHLHICRRVACLQRFRDAKQMFAIISVWWRYFKNHQRRYWSLRSKSELSKEERKQLQISTSALQVYVRLHQFGELRKKCKFSAIHWKSSRFQTIWFVFCSMQSKETPCFTVLKSATIILFPGSIRFLFNTNTHSNFSSSLMRLSMRSTITKMISITKVHLHVKSTMVYKMIRWNLHVMSDYLLFNALF